MYYVYFILNSFEDVLGFYGRIMVLQSEWSLHAFVGWWSQLTGCEESWATNEDLSYQRTNVFWLVNMVNQDVHLSWQCFNDSGFWRTVSTMSRKNRFRHTAQEITRQYV